ncbi:hypothetical protein AOLI_G00235140 [Acnodon oligacanthus]
MFSTLNETCPSGYSYLQKAHSTGRGGGLATIYRSDLDLSYLPLPELSSCECLAFRSKQPSPVTILLIYRPPKPNPSFMPEMYNLLSSLCTTSANILIFGDINIHVNNPSCRFAAEFLQLLGCFSLRQLVDVPTHTRGHTLDLVITDSALVRNLSVHDLGVSDHKDTYSQSEVFQPLNCFPEVSQQEVQGIVRKMKPSTCALDPFPTTLRLHIQADQGELCSSQTLKTPPSKKQNTSE